MQAKVVHTLRPEIQLFSTQHSATSGVMTDTNELEVFEYLIERASAADSPFAFKILAQKDDWEPS